MNNDINLILEYIKQLLNKDKMKLVHFCYKWVGNGEKNFGPKEPEDFVMELIEKIIDRKRKCYLESYDIFLKSCYYHLKNEMLTYFGYSRKNGNINNELNYQIDNSNVSFDEDEVTFISTNLFVKDFQNELETKDLMDNIINLFDPEKE